MTVPHVDSLCPYCGVGCRVRHHLQDGRIAWAEGLDGPANRGRLCVKGRFGWDYAHHPDRLTASLVRRDDAPKVPDPQDPAAQFRAASWDEALDRAAAGFARIKAESGPDALGAFGTAKGSNEEAYLVQKLVRTGFGTNNVDHCARLCHSSSVVALFDQVGSGGVSAAFTQCDNADVLMIVGANPSRSHPVAAAFFKRAALRGATMIVVDPRRSEIAEYADLVVTHRPGSDIPLFNAFAHVILAEGLHDAGFVERRTKGFEEFRRSVEAFPPEAVEAVTGVPAALIREVARTYARARRDDLLGHGRHPARPRRAQRPLPGQPRPDHRQRRPPRHRPAPAARPEQRPGRERHGAVAELPLRLRPGRGPRPALSVRGRLGRGAARAAWPDHRRDGQRRRPGPGAGPVLHGREPGDERSGRAPRPPRALPPRPPRGPGHLPHRDGRARRRRPAGVVDVREVGRLHQHQPPDPALAARDPPAGRRPPGLVDRAGGRPPAGAGLGLHAPARRLGGGARPVAGAARHPLGAPGAGRLVPVPVRARG